VSTTANPVPASQIIAPQTIASQSIASQNISPRTASVASYTVPWYIWTGVVAVTCASVGGAWDVSWHRSIGRDSFWTPAHLLIQLCGVLAGIVGLWLIYQCSAGRDSQLRAASVSVLGLRAPLGVFLAGWGGLAMVTSAPFDNWWHNAYGLDVQIVSPPHTVLILGVRAVAVGMIFLILAAMNRAAAVPAGPGLDSEAWAPTLSGSSPSETNLSDPNPALFRRLQFLFLYLGGLSIHGQMFFLQEFTWDVMLHRASPYIAMGIGLPALFAMIWQASRFRWAASTSAAIYMVLGVAEILILPLFPAQPKLGPVFFPAHSGPALAAGTRLEVLANRTGLGLSLHRSSARGRVAICEVPDDARQPESLLRHRLL
jgi:hypothetical protein